MKLSDMTLPLSVQGSGFDGINPKTKRLRTDVKKSIQISNGRVGLWFLTLLPSKCHKWSVALGDPTQLWNEVLNTLFL